jgi:methyl-accepting chemotaxis protein
MTDPIELSGAGAHDRSDRPTDRNYYWRLTAAGGLLLCCGFFGWLGGMFGVCAGFITAMLLPWLLCNSTGKNAAALPDLIVPQPVLRGGRIGTEVIVSQVLPIWAKQLEIARRTGSTALEQLLESFSAISGSLTALASRIQTVQVHVTPSPVGAGGELDSSAGIALGKLLQASRRACQQRDAAISELVNCGNAMRELLGIGRSARELGKQTRLVAFNAITHARRSSSCLAVADETRMLASRIDEVGANIVRTVARLEIALTPERLGCVAGSLATEELHQALDGAARDALSAMLASLGGALRSSGESAEIARSLSKQLEETFVNFQFGDRFSQMLDIIARDMQDLAYWVSANPYATHSDAADWLAKLEGSYTMESQRSQHHGNFHINRESEIEFF